MESMEVRAARARRDLVLDSLAAGRRVRLGFAGTSMEPLLCEGDVIVVDPPRGRTRAGDVVLYSSSGPLVAHRVLGPARAGGEVLVKGDFTAARAQRLGRDRILGIVVARERSGGRLDLRSPVMAAAGALLAALSPFAVPLAMSLPGALRRPMRRTLLRALGARRGGAGGGGS